MTDEIVKLERGSVPAVDDILGYGFKVLDSGLIRVVDYMGGDEAIVQAARVSYGKGTKKIHEDAGLIRYLMRHRHTTPFEMCEIKFHVRVPMDHWRQWIRHRTANVNEYSTRYSEAIDDTAKTAPDKWRLQSGMNKQGSSGYASLDTGKSLTEVEARLHAALRQEYERRLALGIAKEQARKDLSLSTYTEAYWKCDLHNLLHFLSLRMDRHAQEEIRAYANVMGEIVAKWVPLVWAAFLDYRMNALTLSARDLSVLRAMLANPTAVKVYAEFAATPFGWLERDEDLVLKKNRERDEFEAKLSSLGLRAPWVEA